MTYIAGVIGYRGAREHTVLLDGAHLAALGRGGRQALGVVVEAREDIADGSAVQVFRLHIGNAVISAHLRDKPSFH